MSVREKDDPALYTKIQEQNLLRQYDLLSNCIEIGLKKGIEAFDKYTLWALNYAAVSNICQLGGRFREGPIRVGNHVPPHFNDVPRLMDAFLSVIHENWTIVEHPTALAAFALWNLNWIHPQGGLAFLSRSTSVRRGSSVSSKSAHLLKVNIFFEALTRHWNCSARLWAPLACIFNEALQKSD